MGFVVDTVFNWLGKEAEKKGEKQVIGAYQGAEDRSIAGFQEARDAQLGAYGTARDAQVQTWDPIYSTGVNALARADQMMTPGFQYSPSDPSYAWRFGEGQRAVEGSAAAGGSLNSGGTLKALTRYGQGAASTEFGADFARNNLLAGYGVQGAQGRSSAYGDWAQGTSDAYSDYSRNQANALFKSAEGRASGYRGKADANAGFWGNTKADAGDSITNALSKLFGGF